MSNPLPIVRDRLAAAVVLSGALVVFFALATTIWTTLYKGWPALHHLNFYIHDLHGVGPSTSPLTQGGIYHALWGTGIEVVIATVVSLPLGIATAVFLSEVRGPGTRIVRTVVEAMTALPDILAGLFVYVVLILIVGMQKSGLAAAIALSITMVPIIARSAEVVLRVVPGGLREASLALGASRLQTVWRVVLPTAKAGLATSLILGIARVAGETAPLLIVNGTTQYTNKDPRHDNMTSLPSFVYAGIKSGQPLYIQRAYGAASVLLLIVLVLFVLTRLLARGRGRPQMIVLARPAQFWKGFHLAFRLRLRSRLKRLPLLVVVAIAALLLVPAPPADAVAHQAIEGSGSSWAANAIDVWTTAVSSSGLQVSFTSQGSAQGRKDFGNVTTDFGVSDIGYQGHDPQTGDVDLPCKLGSSDRLPGLRLPADRRRRHCLSVPPDHRVASRSRTCGCRARPWPRSSPAASPTGDDPAITADNNGRKLPAAADHPDRARRGLRLDRAVHPVHGHPVPEHLARLHRQARRDRVLPQGQEHGGPDQLRRRDELHPVRSGQRRDRLRRVLLRPRRRQYPVAKIENQAGYFTLPTQFNVAVALQKAIINTNKNSPDYLLQDLHNVYTDSGQANVSAFVLFLRHHPDRGQRRPDDHAKRQTLADFLYYSVCQGQSAIGQVGYSALPLNLVQASFGQIGKLKTADPKVDLTKRDVTTCNNPTFTPGNLSHNHLADIARYPPACDQAGQGPCLGAGDPGTQFVGVGGTVKTNTAATETRRRRRQRPRTTSNGRRWQPRNSGKPHPAGAGKTRTSNAPTHEDRHQSRYRASRNRLRRGRHARRPTCSVSRPSWPRPGRRT